MKAKDWQKAAQLVQERQSQAAMADTTSSVASPSVNYQWTKVGHPP